MRKIIWHHWSDFQDNLMYVGMNEQVIFKPSILSRKCRLMAYCFGYYNKRLAVQVRLLAFRREGSAIAFKGKLLMAMAFKLKL